MQCTCLLICLIGPPSIHFPSSVFPVFPQRAHPLSDPSCPGEVHSTAQPHSERVAHLKPISLAHSLGHNNFLREGNYLLGSWEWEAFSYPPQDCVKKMGSWRFQGPLHRALGGAREWEQSHMGHPASITWVLTRVSPEAALPAAFSVTRANEFFCFVFLLFKLLCLGFGVTHSKKIPNLCVFHQANVNEDVSLTSPSSTKYW